MPFDFLDGLDSLINLLNLDLSSKSSSVKGKNKNLKKQNILQKYRVEAFL